jgi:hypothetical protein
MLMEIKKNSIKVEIRQEFVLINGFAIAVLDICFKLSDCRKSLRHRDLKLSEYVNNMIVVTCVKFHSNIEVCYKFNNP